MEYKRELSQEEITNVDPPYFEYLSKEYNSGFHDGYIYGRREALSSLPSPSEIAQLKTDNEKLRQALEKILDYLPGGGTYHDLATTILSETKTINP